MTGDKFRLRFTKTGTLRLVSHHDLMRCGERMLRRAALPFKSTAGFHPTPRLVFALSLPLGADALDEVVELELTEPRDSDDVLAALRAQAPTGLAFTSATVVPMKATARARRVVYELPLPAERVPQVRAAVAELLAQPKVWVERLKPSPKRLNIRPYVRGAAVVEEPNPPAPFPKREGGGLATEDSVSDPARGMLGASAPPSLLGKGAGGLGSSAALRLDLWVTQEGTARVGELLDLLNVSDLLDAGTVLARTRLELRDELTEEPTDAPPDGPSDSVPLRGAEVAALAARLDAEANEQPVESGWGASPNGPVVE
jgi:radical SAM-linked protein